MDYDFKATWSDAWNYCCLYDMKLVTVETSTRHACLTKFLKGFEINEEIIASDLSVN